MKKTTIKKKCEKCKHLMKEWFNQQVHTGYMCTFCGTFIKVAPHKVKGE